MPAGRDYGWECGACGTHDEGHDDHLSALRAEVAHLEKCADGLAPDCLEDARRRLAEATASPAQDLASHAADAAGWLEQAFMVLTPDGHITDTAREEAKACALIGIGHALLAINETLSRMAAPVAGEGKGNA